MRNRNERIFLYEVKIALDEITEDVVARLLSVRNWRDKLTGSWFCGLKKWDQFAEQIGVEFLASKACYAGQGYAFAFACFADEVSVRYLTEYLDHYLALPDCYYDQDWAMTALMWIDAQRATSHAQKYLVSGGLWDNFTVNKKSGWDLQAQKDEFWQMMAYCQTRLLSSVK